MDDKFKATQNVKDAITALENFVEAMDKMDVDEFDYCYSKLIRELNVDVFSIKNYIKSMKKDMTS